MPVTAASMRISPVAVRFMQWGRLESYSSDIIDIEDEYEHVKGYKQC